MKNKQLAQWLQEHVEMLGHTDRRADKALYVALYEGIIDVALHGETRLLNSVLESAAAHAVAVNRSLIHLLSVPQRLRERIWERIGEEIDPEPAFAMLAAVDTIFVHIVRVTIDAYQEAGQLAMAAKATEISRLYSESKEKVLEYAAEVARANRELAQLEQAKTDFISIAAHELKTPLTLIQGYVNIILDLDSEGKLAKWLNGISRGAVRMNTIIENMLDLSAMDMQQFSLFVEPVNLKSAVDLALIQLDQALTERKQTVQTLNLESLPFIEADTRRLHQILKHILSNAIKYTPDGGRITIRGARLEAASDRPASVQLTVEDTGVGIAPEDREKVFDKFYRAGNSNLHSTSETGFMGAGPGLGLAIVKGLVEAHGGRVWAESQGFDMQNYPGSVFNLILPLQVVDRPEIQIDRLNFERIDE